MMNKTLLCFFLSAISTISFASDLEQRVTALEARVALLEQAQASDDAIIICEGEKGLLQCSQNERIQFQSAFWGRDDHSTCPKVPSGLTSDRLCETNASNTLLKVEGQCENEQACEVVASNIFFDDNTCGNVYKYLKVTYTCITD